MRNSIYIKLVFIVMLVFLPSCDEENQSSDSSGAWLIPESEIRDGGPGKDGIIALNLPNFVPLSQVNYLAETDLVVGIRIGDITRAFPHSILDHHEIVNDLIADTAFTLSYCPLTGSTLAWDVSSFPGDKTFGVSGSLYNSNLILYDRETDSFWSQILQLCVNGELIGQDAVSVHIIETNWKTWKQLYPQSLIMSNDTGYNNNYNVYPYGSYKTNESLLFPVSNEDSRLLKKERVHGIVLQDNAKVYRIEMFQNPLEVINDSFKGTEVVVVGSAVQNFAVAFKRQLSDGTLLNFQAVEGELPVIMQDQEGTKWDIFGRGMSGSREGEELSRIPSFTAYWFSWAAFFPGVEIYTSSAVSTSGLSDMHDFASKMERKRLLLREKREYDRHEISRRIIREWSELLEGIRVGLYSQNNQILGWRLLQLPVDSVLWEIGFREGDIIKRVNALNWRKMSAFSPLFKEFKNSDHIIVQVERDGMSFELEYNLKRP